MSTPIESVACIATSPMEAMLFVATLKAEGIPARVEGDNLTDEWAASRRMLNLLGTAVMVPTSSVARARELLQPTDVDPAELERQALAAAPEAPLTAHGTATAVASPDAPAVLWGLLLAVVIAVAIAVAFVMAS